MATQPTKIRPINNRPTVLFEPEYFLFEKKTGYGQIQTMERGRPCRIRYLRVKLSRDAKKMNSLRTKVPTTRRVL